MKRLGLGTVVLGSWAACGTPSNSGFDSADDDGTTTASTHGQETTGQDEGSSATMSSSTSVASTSTGAKDSDASEDGSSSGEDTSAGSSHGDSSSGTTAAGTSTSASEASSEDSTDTLDDEPHPLWVHPNLWYSVENKLHYIEIDPEDGTVVRLVTSTITTELIDGQNGITMLEDGSLLGSRERAGETQIYHIPDPPTEPSTLEVDIIGIVPDALRIEALYTDCQGLVYLMDTGADVSSAEGNRLIRFMGDYLAGDLSYEVITDLQNSSVADIDDMGPGIDERGEITDGRGFAIDSGAVYDFDYNVGTGVLLGHGGTWGIHALGGPLFLDRQARLYLLNGDAELFEADPADLTLSDILVTGPAPEGNARSGWSSLAGPLTECESTLPVPQ